jgi:opacity protein-like surface antigen
MKTPTLFKWLPLTIACCLAAGRLIAQDTNTGWYLKADAGPAFVQDINTTSTDIFGGTHTTRISFSTGVRLDLDCGYQIDRAWAVEGEVGYIYNATDFSNSTGSGSSSFYQVPVMVNGIYTAPVDWFVKPYGGLGVGVVVSGLDNLEDVTAAGQVIVGAKCKLSQRWDAGLAYRFLATSSHDWNGIFTSTEGSGTLTHSVVATVGFKF